MKSVSKTSVVPFLIGAAFIFAHAPTCSAEIAMNCDLPSGRLCFIKITGTITAEDARVVANIPAEIGRGNPSRVVHVNLNSRGGDTEAAIAIGRVLRSLHVVAQVGMDQICASACVLLLAAGTTRIVATGLPGHVKGRVGIHRLYSMSTSEKDYDSLQRKYQQIESKVRAYLREMNVPESLYDAMMRIPSENIHFLSESELTAYSLNVDDPVYADLVNSKDAARYGLTKPEYLARKARGDRECKADYEAFGIDEGVRRLFECQEAIFRGRK
jgi:hypothetical protein